jgi:hypothetical protein
VPSITLQLSRSEVGHDWEWQMSIGRAGSQQTYVNSA